MKRLMILGTLTAGLVGCGGGTPTRAETVAGLTGSATNGKSVYESTCSSCHGANAKGTATGSNLVAAVKARTAESFLGSVINGVTGTVMTAYGNSMTDQQLADLLAYVKELSK